MKPLKKLNPDVSYIDPLTMKVVCTFNGCIEKFTIQKSDEVRKVFEWSGDREVVWQNYYHACKECNRTISTKEDKKRSMMDFMANRGL